mmetsp:Transcript_39354/g.37794  ORF Transcript_39354/g.37794 Transcript_39354/m.37794 type:complete len:232 (-) Transcript_39354:31-726(-)
MWLVKDLVIGFEEDAFLKLDSIVTALELPELRLRVEVDLGPTGYSPLVVIRLHPHPILLLLILFILEIAKWVLALGLDSFLIEEVALLGRALWSHRLVASLTVVPRVATLLQGLVEVGLVNEFVFLLKHSIAEIALVSLAQLVAEDTGGSSSHARKHLFAERVSVGVWVADSVLEVHHTLIDLVLRELLHALVVQRLLLLLLQVIVERRRIALFGKVISLYGGELGGVLAG